MVWVFYCSAVGGGSVFDDSWSSLFSGSLNISAISGDTDGTTSVSAGEFSTQCQRNAIERAVCN